MEVDCAWCGLVTVAMRELGCAVSEADGGGLCQFICPLCGRLVTKRLGLLDIRALILAGVSTSQLAPLELLEHKNGDVVSWDDVLDFRLALRA